MVQVDWVGLNGRGALHRGRALAGAGKSGGRVACKQLALGLGRVLKGLKAGNLPTPPIHPPPSLLPPTPPLPPPPTHPPTSYTEMTTPLSLLTSNFPAALPPVLSCPGPGPSTPPHPPHSSAAHCAWGPLNAANERRGACYERVFSLLHCLLLALLLAGCLPACLPTWLPACLPDLQPEEGPLCSACVPAMPRPACPCPRPCPTL